MKIPQFIILSLLLMSLQISAYTQNSNLSDITKSSSELQISNDSVSTVIPETIIELMPERMCRCICQLPAKISFADISVKPVEPVIVTKTTSAFIDQIVYPNPTRDKTTLSFEVNEDELFNITLFDLKGREVQSIHSGKLKKGRQTFNIDLSDLESGLYTVVISSSNALQTLKIQRVN